MSVVRPARSVRTALALAVCLLSRLAPAGEPIISGYTDYAALGKQVEELAKLKDVTATSLGTTLGDRKVWLLTIGRGKPDEKPAILIMGNVHAPHLLGSELAMRLARRLADKAQEDPNKQLLDRVTFYVIPRPTPDASEAFFTKPYQQRTGNERPTDDDRDGSVDEDPADDLNADGLITVMRVADDAGHFMPHASDPRVMTPADAKKNEKGRYALYLEGRDDDGDEQYNEDGPGGVAFNRNFTFRYPFFKPGAGPHQVSEVETRAVADFCFDHTNIALVFTFTPEDNLMKPWKPGNDSARIKTTVATADAPYFNFIAERYRKEHGGKDAPASPPGAGSFSEWAYFHFGRWSLAARGWWIPKVPGADAAADKTDKTEKPATDDDKSAKTDDKTEKDAEKSTDEDGEEKTPGRAGPPTPAAATASSELLPAAAEQLNALRWFDREGIPGFVEWTRVEQPDFPGKQVEVGGIKPFYLLNPPDKELDPLADKHVAFLLAVTELMPRLSVHDLKVEALGGNVFRVTAQALNSGYLPTMSEMGRTANTVPPLQIKIELPPGAKLVQGSPRTQLRVLSGNGGQQTHTWLVQTEGKPGEVKVTAWSPCVGSNTATAELK